MTPKDVACIILASGLSQRFGTQDKLEADLCAQPLVSHVIETAKQVGFGEIFLVSNRRSGEGCVLIKNKNPEAGQGYALRSGLKAARMADWEYSMIILGDMPLISSSYLKKMIANNKEKQSSISISETSRMPPALFYLDVTDEILRRHSQHGARDVLNEFPLQIVELPSDFALDVDTPEDLARVEHIMKARQK